MHCMYSTWLEDVSVNCFQVGFCVLPDSRHHLGACYVELPDILGRIKLWS